MIKNYLKVAFRNLLRSPGYAGINIIGLALGIVCCLMIGLYVQDELSFDRYHENSERIYRVNTEVRLPDDPDLWDWAGGALAEDMGDAFPSIEHTVRFLPQNKIVQFASDTNPAEDRSFREEHFFFADETVFDVFTYDFLQGDPASAFGESGSVVLTRSTAERYFGGKDPMGQVLLYDNQLPLTVTGVIRDVPSNSHLRFDMLAPMGAFKATQGMPSQATFGSYWWPFTYTYVLMQDAPAAMQLEAQLPAFIQERRRDGATYVPTLQPLHDIHLHTLSAGDASAGVTRLRILIAIALAILLLACVNFVNLATSRSLRRAREVGLRKSIGAYRLQVMLQFLGESAFMCLLAVVFAIGLLYLGLPMFNDLAARDIAFTDALNPLFLGGMGGLLVITSLLAGAYPALFLSRFQAVDVLKGTVAAQAGRAWLRKGLVVFQFTVSVVLIAGTAIAFAQLQYMQNAGLGFDKEQIVTVRVEDGAGWSRFKQGLEERSEVVDAVLSTPRPGLGRGIILPYRAESVSFDETAQPRTDLIMVDYGYFEMLGLQMVAGRAFSPAFPADEGLSQNNTNPYLTTNRGLVINETMMAKNGWTPETALGKEMQAYALEDGVYYTNIEGTVVGVVEDFHHSSLHEDIMPVVLTLAKTPAGYVGGWALIKVQPGNAAQTADMIQSVWREANPDSPFEVSFLDSDLNNQYIQEARTGRIMGTFAMLGIVIACMGLLGLAAYDAEQRKKEIGVRRVLGASVTQVIGLLTRDFLVLVFVAVGIGLPVSFIAMKQWLNDFAYQISIHPTLLAGISLIVVAIAFATVCTQAYRAALMDPVKTLQYE